MIIHCSRSPFEFAPVRAFLRNVGYKPRSLPEKVAFSLVDPLDPASLDTRQSSHLTDATTRKAQLRFFSERLIHHHVLTLAYAAAQACPSVARIELRRCENLSKTAMLFFRVLGRHLPQCDIRLGFGGVREPDEAGLATDAERACEALYYRDSALTDDQFDALFDAAHSCSYMGDYWTARRLLERLEREKNHTEVNVLLGVAANAAGRGFLAEYYYRRNYRAGDALETIRVCYSLSMLFIRHHAPAFRDVDKGAEFLQEAFELLNELDPHDRDQRLAFRKVFNRNGYALVLFKRKRIHEAIALLDAGLARLEELATGSVALHRSVLMYNRMLCFKALGDFDTEVECFRQLVALDPLYPYYRLDFAKSLLGRGHVTAAIEAADEARAINPFLSESHAILGECYQSLDQNDTAEQHLRRACELDPLNPYHVCKLGQLWNKLDKHELTYRALRRERIDDWSDAEFESATCLQAESSVMVNEVTEEALLILQRGLARRDDSEVLRRNYDLLRELGGVQ